MAGLIDAAKMNDNLAELVLKISHIRMNLKDLKMLFKTIRGIRRLSDLKLDVWIKNKNNTNLLKPFSKLASLS